MIKPCFFSVIYDPKLSILRAWFQITDHSHVITERCIAGCALIPKKLFQCQLCQAHMLDYALLSTQRTKNSKQHSYFIQNQNILYQFHNYEYISKAYHNSLYSLGLLD